MLSYVEQMNKMSKYTVKIIIFCLQTDFLSFLSMIYAINSGSQDLPQMC